MSKRYHIKFIEKTNLVHKEFIGRLNERIIGKIATIY